VGKRFQTHLPEIKTISGERGECAERVSRSKSCKKKKQEEEGKERTALRHRLKRRRRASIKKKLEERVGERGASNSLVMATTFKRSIKLA